MKLNRIAEIVNDRINPILLKEMRQSVRSRLMALIFIVTITILLIAMGIFVVSGSPSGATASDQVLELGKNAFSTLLVIFITISLFFVPIFSGLRMQRERAKADIDLLFTTTLSPMAIMRGKLLTGICITGLITSACLPFMTFTYFLRGVDLPSILIILAAALISIITVTQCTLCVATVSHHKLLRSLGTLILAGTMIAGFSYTLFIIFNMLDGGIGSQIGQWPFWRNAAFFLIPMLLINGLFFIASATAISPPSSNRALALRIYFTGAILLSGLLVVLDDRYKIDYFPQDLWRYLCMVLICGGFITAVCEREKLNLRIARTVPHALLKRVPAFLFYSGSAGGLAWVLLILMPAFLGIDYLIGPLWNESFKICLGLCLYALAYALTGLWLRRKVFYKWLPPAYTFIPVVLVALVVHILPIPLLFLFSGDFAHGIHHWGQYGNILYFTENPQPARIAFAATWSAIAGIGNSGWFIKQMLNFKHA